MEVVVDSVGATPPLRGVRVVEVGVWHAGPGAGAILADLGAEVIKVEPPSGDPERHVGDFGPMRTASVDTADWTVLYEASNRGKKGICVDLRQPSGRLVLNRLVERADVFLTNLLPASKTSMGIDYDSLRAVNPEIVHVSVSGFGSQGSMAGLGAFDSLGQAMSGMMFLNGDEPAPIAVLVLDQLAAITASQAAVTALLSRQLHGHGQDVHVSLYGSAVWAMHANLLATSATGTNIELTWNRELNSPLRTTFKAGDGQWMSSTNHPEQKWWPVFCTAVGHPELVDDVRFSTKEGRREFGGDLYRILDATMLARGRDEWLAIFRDAGLFFAPIKTFKDVLDDEQARVNGYIVEAEHPVMGTWRIPGSPFQFGSWPTPPAPQPAPRLGQHTRDVLAENGFDPDEIDGLIADGVIAQSGSETHGV